jgi:hypothetical protein
MILNITSTGEVRFTSPDGGGTILVSVINHSLPNETRLSTQDLAKEIISPSPGKKVIEVNANDYFLSGHPAVRVIGIQSYAASEGIEPYDAKTMIIAAPLSGKVYSVGYASLPERFNDYLQTAQTMIESFQIMSKQ